MRVAKDDTIAGVNAKVLRDYFRRLRGRSFIAEDMVVELGMSPEEARQLAERLRAEGFVVPEAHSDPSDSRHWFELDTRGNALAQANFGKRFSRQRAEELLRGVIERAVEINGDNNLTHRVAEIRVFGSYLTDASDLGDLDLAYMLEVRHPGQSIVELSMARARLSGRQSMPYFDQLTFGQREVARLLKARKPHISLHEMHELEQLGVEGVVVFPA